MGLCPRCQLKAYLLPVPGRVLSHFVLLSLLAGSSLMAHLGASQALSPVAQTQWFSFLPAGLGGAVRTQGWEKGGVSGPLGSPTSGGTEAMCSQRLPCPQGPGGWASGSEEFHWGLQAVTGVSARC